jgi:hypothetical protein
MSSAAAVGLRNRHSGSQPKSNETQNATAKTNNNNNKNAAVNDDDPDNWTWAEFRDLLVRALAVIVLFSVMHIMVQKVLLDPFAGLEPPFTEADAQRIANQRFG